MTVTTTPPVDVNEELFNQRRAAIDSGAVTARDDGSYVYADKAEVFARMGLDMTTGQAALYTKVPAWHSLGNVRTEGVSNIDEVLELAGLAFNVVVVPSLYQWKRKNREHAGEFVTVRDDTGDALGKVGNRYANGGVIQNRQAFDFLQDLVDKYDVVWESAGALRGGEKTFVSMRLPNTVTIDAEGINDTIVPFVVALNSHNGISQFKVVVTPWRPVCANTERFAVRDAYTRWGVRHTSNSLQKLEEARKTLGLSLTYYEKFAEEETALARQAMAIDEFHGFIDSLWKPPAADAAKSAVTRAKARKDDMTAMFEANAETVGKTAYAAERTVTEFLDWKTRVRAPKSLSEDLVRAARVLEGDADEKKTVAHEKLMLLVR